MSGSLDNPVPGTILHKRKATLQELIDDVTFTNGQIGFVGPSRAYVKLNDEIFPVSDVVTVTTETELISAIGKDQENAVIYNAKEGLVFESSANINSNKIVIGSEVIISGAEINIDADGRTSGMEIDFQCPVKLEKGGETYPLGIYQVQTPGGFGIKLRLNYVYGDGDIFLSNPWVDAEYISISGSVGFSGAGDGIQNNWDKVSDATLPVATGAKEISHNKIGFFSRLQSSISGFLFDVWGSGFRTEELFGSDIAEAFNALPSTISNGVALTYTNFGDVIGIGSEAGAVASQHAAKLDINNTVSQIDIPEGLYYPRTAINGIDEKDLFLTCSLSDSQILKSSDLAASWDVVFTASDVIGAITKFIDGTIVATMSALNGDTPIPVISSDNGDSFIEGSNPIADTKIPTGLSAKQLIYMQHSDNSVYFACVDTTTVPANRVKLYSASAIGGVWTEVSEVYNFGTVDENISCTYIDPANDDIYIGMQSDGTNDLALRKTADGGATWSTVYTAPIAESFFITKFFKAHDNVFYALVSGTGLFTSKIVKTIDNCETWTTVLETSNAINDMVYVPIRNSIYLIRSNDADSKGFIVESIELEKDFATMDNSTPIKARMRSKQFDISISKEIVNAGDQVPFGLPELSVTQNSVGILRDYSAPTFPHLVPPGSFFRNILDSKFRLFLKAMDGTISPVQQDHDETANKKGGAPGEYNHLTDAQVAAIGGGGGGGGIETTTFPKGSLYEDVLTALKPIYVAYVHNGPTTQVNGMNAFCGYIGINGELQLGIYSSTKVRLGYGSIPSVTLNDLSRVVFDNTVTLVGGTRYYFAILIASAGSSMRFVRDPVQNSSIYTGFSGLNTTSLPETETGSSTSDSHPYYMGAYNA